MEKCFKFWFYLVQWSIFVSVRSKLNVVLNNKTKT